MVAAVDKPRKQEQERASGEVTEVAPGILRTQLPIDMPGLGHVNMYLIEDGKGVAVVDPGIPGDESWAAVNERLAQAGIPLDRVHTIVVTHSHPDHFGNAMRLVEATGADLITHAAFRWWDSDCDHIDDVAEDDLIFFDWSSETTPWGGQGYGAGAMRKRFQSEGVWMDPQPTKRLRDGETIRLGGRDVFAVYTPGHTIDHLCLHDPEAGVLLSGDHVLPTITPHISGTSNGRDPLSQFYASLDRTASLEGIEMVLPAHGHPFADLAGRCEDIKDHHRERLQRLRGICRSLGPATVMEIARLLFQERNWGPMAESETYAHLEHLRLGGEAERIEKDGSFVYSLL